MGLWIKLACLSATSLALLIPYSRHYCHIKEAWQQLLLLSSGLAICKIWPLVMKLYVL